MNPIKIFILVATSAWLIAVVNHSAIAQGHPGNGQECNSCNDGPQYQDGYNRSYNGEDLSAGYAHSSSCDCQRCNQRSYNTPIRTAAGRARDRRNDRIDNRYADQDYRIGRPGEKIGAPFVTGQCDDCNRGPVYLSVFAGGAFIDSFQNEATFDNGVAGAIGVNETSFSTLDGVAAGGAIGRYFYRQARVEFEYTFRDNGVGDQGDLTFSDDLATPDSNDTLLALNVSDATGNFQTNSFIFNFIGDLRPRSIGCLNGYLGGGIGVIHMDADLVTATDTFAINDASFAFQGTVGINFPLKDRLDLFSEYRYLGANSLSVERTTAEGSTVSSAFEFDSHNVVFGLRFLR